MNISELFKPRLLPRLLVGVTLALAPLPFGSVNRAWAAPWCALLGVSLALLSLRELRWAHAVRLVPVLVFGAVFGAAVWAQHAGFALWGVAHPIWTETAQILQATVTPYPTVQVPGLVPLGPPLAMLLVFCCAFLVSVERSGAEAILKICAQSGLAYAMFGFAAMLADPEQILGATRPGYIGTLTGPFVNRNTAATYFGSCALVWFMMMVDRLDQHLTAEGIGLTEVSRLLREPSKRLMLALFGFFACMTAVLMTGSRAGTLLTVSAVAVVGGLYLRRRLSGYAQFPLFVVALILAAGVFLEFWGGLVAFRLGQFGLMDESRWETYKATLAMIADHPWLGTGHGTFTDAFPAYRSAEVSVQGVWDLAHNTLLELTAELGLAVGIAAVGAGIAVFMFLLRGVFQRRRDAMFPLTAFGVGLLGTLHSLVDFSIQIQGFGIVFAGLVGSGLAQTVSSMSANKRLGPSTSQTLTSGTRSEASA